MERRTVLRGLLAVPLGAAAATYLADPANADYTTTVNPSVNWGTWEGWGTSLAWWAAAFGDRDDLADIFFTRNTVQYQGQSLPGLGLNIVRYNAGASTWHSINGESMVTSPNMIPGRQVEGYWLDWYSADPASSSWNWYADSKQRNMMWKARDRGVNQFELFSNSPMWWMCKNHNPSGAADGSENLQSWNYDQHAVYLATIARYAHDRWGVNFTSVEPFNEPSSSWWKADGTQEGCHFDLSTQRTVINNLRAELNARDLGWMPVTASDCSYYDEATAALNSFDSGTRNNIGRINVHGYQYGGGRRDLLFNAASAAGKRIWNSEYGGGDTSGMETASNLNLDFRWLHPTAWVYWQVVDGGGWGLIQSGNGATGQVNPKYFVLAQYMRHIRPGMRIIDGGEGNTVAAYDAANHKLVIVGTNYGTGQWINYDLSRFGTPSHDGALVDRWCTNTGGGDSYVHHADTYVRGTRFWSWFAPNTVQTFEVPGVYL
ncbi:beta-1,6-galactanase [Solihabitans fulvus]|uniref:Beta-1,6-galactanase n=1 Tax=Solihabitans fulvus TaxID=1892852 RepID=A0A5B2XV13_9PSEU|nr:glycoside hydrolase [Solihabitans fulvus]KAA2266591.1 beta-1,6-galactanase [Solihabitans fulvus]